MTGAQYRLTGRLQVDLEPADAFGLFTPRGEAVWVPGWQPRFPHAATDATDADDTSPGTVFETVAHGRTTTWIVVDREVGRRISYARFTPGDRAGTVTVDLRPTGERKSDVTVTYELTALNDAAGTELRDFAANYPAFIQSWQDAIAG